MQVGMCFIRKVRESKRFTSIYLGALTMIAVLSNSSMRRRARSRHIGANAIVGSYAHIVRPIEAQHD